MINQASYPWYPRDWRGDPHVQSMTLFERGLYRELLDICWIEDGLPYETKIIAKMLGIDHVSFKRKWNTLQKRFVKVEREGVPFYHHKRLLSIQEKQRSYAEKQRDRARARWQRAEHEEACAGNATALPRAGNASNGMATRYGMDISRREIGGVGEGVAPEAFERAWSAWRGTGSREASLAAWRQVNPDEETAEQIVAGINTRNDLDQQWQEEPRYIGTFASMLHKRRWDWQPPAEPQNTKHHSGNGRRPQPWAPLPEVNPEFAPTFEDEETENENV